MTGSDVVPAGSDEGKEPMRGKRLTIFVGESDKWHHAPLYMAMLQLLKRSGISGATVTRGIAGFGEHSAIKTINLLELSIDLPIVLTVVDRTERIESILPELSAMMAGGTITLEDVEIVYASAGFRGGLPEIVVSQIMRREVETAHPETSVAEIVQRLVRQNFTGLPVVDDERRVVGFVDESDLIEARLTQLSVSEQRVLDADQLEALVASLKGNGVRVEQVMRRPAITISPSTSLRDAAHRMNSAGVKHLPVVDDRGLLVGIVGRLDVLESVASGYERRTGEHLPRLPQESAVVADVMERDVARVPETAPLLDVAEKLLGTAAHRVVVADPDGRPLGIVSPSDLIARVDPEGRPGLLRLLQSRWSEAAQREVRKSTGRRAADVMTAPVVSVVDREPIIGALRTMVRQHLKHLPVVDSAGRVVGMVSRQAVLAASLAGDAAPRV